MGWFDILKAYPHQDPRDELNLPSPFKPRKTNIPYPFFPRYRSLYDKKPLWFPSRAGKGGQKVFKKWLRPFIRKYLEKMAVGDMITTKKVLEVVKKNMSAPQLKTKRISPNTIGTLIGENRDIIKREAYQTEYGRGGWRRI